MQSGARIYHRPDQFDPAPVQLSKMNFCVNFIYGSTGAASTRWGRQSNMGPHQHSGAGSTGAASTSGPD